MQRTIRRESDCTSMPVTASIGAAFIAISCPWPNNNYFWSNCSRDMLGILSNFDSNVDLQIE